MSASFVIKNHSSVVRNITEHEKRRSRETSTGARFGTEDGQRRSQSKGPHRTHTEVCIYVTNQQFDKFFMVLNTAAKILKRNNNLWVNAPMGLQELQTMLVDGRCVIFVREVEQNRHILLIDEHVIVQIRKN